MFMDTGEVVDLHVLSKTCEDCKAWDWMNPTSETYLAWKQEHEASGKCRSNYSGSSPAMEMKAAEVIFSRSLEAGLRYASVVSDGDSKTLSNLNDQVKPYRDFIIKKLECVNHVHKRLFTNLKNLRLKNPAIKGGRHGLSDAYIKTLSRYYRNTVYRHQEKSDSVTTEMVTSLQRGLLAGLYHNVLNNDPEIQHQYCPDDQWCKWKKDKIDEDVIRHLTTDPVAGLAAIPGTILNHVLKATAVNFSSNKAHLGLPKNHGNCEARDCDLCNKVYEKYITCDEQQREHLATATTSQDSALWQNQRKIRITSSGAFEVPKKADPKNWLDRKLNNRFMGNSSTRYGQECEPIARSYYEHTFRKKITSTGLVVHPTDNWLGASLDGIVDRDTILEIKCPTEKKLEQYNRSLTNMLQANKYDVRVVNGNYVLRQTTAGSGYYYQVQIAMHCSGKSKCNFLVWTPSEQVIVDVLYDQEWVGKQLHHLRGMYFGHLLPAISTMIAHGHLKIKGL